MVVNIDRWSWSKPVCTLRLYVAALSIVDVHNRVLLAEVFVDQIIELIVLIRSVIEDHVLVSRRVGDWPQERHQECD